MFFHSQSRPLQRKLLWLTLPLVLCASVWGLKWRADHPTPTKEDLRIRALMLKYSEVEILYAWPSATRPKSIAVYITKIPKEELKTFVDCFFLSPKQDGTNVKSLIPSMESQFSRILARPGKDEIATAPLGVVITQREGKVFIYRSGKTLEHKIHPVTAKRWTHFLLNHPRIGPELRARMQR